MGSGVSKAFNAIGAAAGNVAFAPYKLLLARSCDGICSGTWDVECFIENLCISSLARLVMILILTYFIFWFVYLLFKLGIFKCIARGAGKMCCSCCHAMEDMASFLWHKLLSTKRVYRGRRRRRDVEEGFSSSSSSYSDSDSDEDGGDDNDDEGSSGSSRAAGRRRRPVRERRKERLRRALQARVAGGGKRRHGSGAGRAKETGFKRRRTR